MAVRRRRKKRLNVLQFLGLILALWLLFCFGKGMVTNYRLKLEIADIKMEIDAIRMRNAELEREIEKYNSPEYVEKIAREELGLVKPGETLFIMSQPLDE